VLLLFARVELERDGERRPLSTWGTGFFASAAGHIVTNKHVVASWLFTGTAAEMIDEGFAVDEGSLLIAAWPAGAAVRTGEGIDLASGWSTRLGTLQVVARTADVFAAAARRGSDGSRRRGRYHALDPSDLVILKADVAAPVQPLLLAGNADPVEKLDPVMVLGYPGNISCSESPIAVTSPSLGEVRKVETSIFVTAPIVPGNSGGPLLDGRGRVIGVAYASFGDATVGGCIPVRYVRELLPPEWR
jgi:S1-C subfamily serine protease